MREPHSVLITGASSGLGAALARAYARPGQVLELGGRNRARLDATAAACAARGAVVRPTVVDVTDRNGLKAWIADAWQRQPLDLVIANAGISAGTGATGTSATDTSAAGTRSAGTDAAGEDEAQVAAIFATNLTGALDTVHAALGLMLARPLPARRGQATGGQAGRPRGQIALMSSIAGFRGFAGAPAYCASKAAVRVYGEALRDAHAGAGIEVSVICPGFVRTPMTAVNPFPMPFLIDADRAAARIVRGLARNRARIAFPRRLYWIVRAIDLATGPLTDRLTRRLPAKPAAGQSKR